MQHWAKYRWYKNCAAVNTSSYCQFLNWLPRKDPCCTENTRTGLAFREAYSNIPILLSFPVCSSWHWELCAWKTFPQVPCGIFCLELPRSLQKHLGCRQTGSTHQGQDSECGEATQGMWVVEVWAWLSKVHTLQSSVLLPGKKKRKKKNLTK